MKLVQKACETCGFKFEKSPYSSQKYCRIECRKSYTSSKLNIGEPGENIPCKRCGKTFLYNKSKPHRIFCTEYCRNEYYRENYRKKTPSEEEADVENAVRDIYKRVRRFLESGEFRYQSDSFSLTDFTEKLKEEILSRDQHKCFVCSAVDTQLEVHHIVKRRLGGSNDSSNLVTLCTKCHRAIDTYDEEYAVRKCLHNFKTRKSDPVREELTSSDKIATLMYLTTGIFDELSARQDDEFTDILTRIDTVLSQIS